MFLVLKGGYKMIEKIYKGIKYTIVYDSYLNSYLYYINNVNKTFISLHQVKCYITRNLVK